MPELQANQPAKRKQMEEGEDARVNMGDMEGKIGTQKKPVHRGKRSRKAQTVRQQKYVESGGPERAQKTINNLTEIRHPWHYPDAFVSIKKNQELVRQTVLKEYPDATNPETLPSVPSLPHAILKIPTPSYQLLNDPEHPPYLLLRLDSIITPKNQGVILRAWDCLQATSPSHLIKREGARSATPAYHWGVWEVTAQTPYITSESKKQTPEAILAIDNLLGLVKKMVVPKIIKMTKDYLPNQWLQQERAHKRVKAWLHKELIERPALDFNGAFFAIAVKEGASERVHIDFNDAKKTITWIWAVGEWEGAEFAAPQLGIRVPLQPGQMIGVMAGVIAHVTTPKRSGRRVIFTCFTEQLLWTHTNLPPIIIV